MAVTLSEAILSKRFTDVLEDDRFDPREFRLSETGACPRLRVLRVLGYEPEPYTEEDARYFERGRIAEAWVVDQYRRQFPRKTRRQATVRTPYGATGHIDLWFPAERRIIEVKSASRGVFDKEIPREEHIMQVQAYLHFFRDAQDIHRADDAELVYVCMDTLRTRVFPVKRDPAIGERIDSELAELYEHALSRSIPPVKGFPDEPPCTVRMPSGPRRCPMWQHCHHEDSLGLTFGIRTVAGFEASAEEYARVKGAIDAAKRDLEQRLKPLEEKLEALRQALEEGLDALGLDQMEAGNYIITRTRVPGRVTYDIEAATQAGVLPMEVRAALMAYAREGKPYSRFTVRLKKGGKDGNGTEQGNNNG